MSKRKMIHPLEINPAWQEEAEKLLADGWEMYCRSNSVLPCVFRKGEQCVHLVAVIAGRSQAWAPTQDEIPEFFTADTASRYTGMARVTFKKEIARRSLPTQVVGRRTRIASDEELYNWLCKRPQRGAITESYRTRKALVETGFRSLASSLRAAIRAQDIDFALLFQAMKEKGVNDPLKLLRSDIYAFMEQISELSRQTIIDLLAKD